MVVGPGSDFGQIPSNQVKKLQEDDISSTLVKYITKYNYVIEYAIV